MSSIEKEVKSSESTFHCFDQDEEYSRMEKRLEELGETRQKGYLLKKEEDYSISYEDELYRNVCTIQGKINNVETVMYREKIFSGGVLETTKFLFKKVEGFGDSQESKVEVGVFPAGKNCFSSYERLKKFFEKYESVAYDVNKEEDFKEMEARYPTAKDFEEIFMSEEEKIVTEKRLERLAKMKRGLKYVKSERLNDQSPVDEDYAYLENNVHCKGSELRLKVKMNGKEIEAYKFSDRDKEGNYIVKYNVKEDGKKIRVEGENIRDLAEDLFSTYENFAYCLDGEYALIEEINRERLSQQKGNIDRRSTCNRIDDIYKGFIKK